MRLKVRTYSNGTLSDGRNTIVLNSALLTNTMPVNASAVGSESVGDMDLQGISLCSVSVVLDANALRQAYPVGFNCGSRDSSVYSQDNAFKSVWRSRDIGDLEPVL